MGTTAKRGKPVTLYLSDEDMDLVETLREFIASAGHKASNSLAVKAAIRSARRDANFLAGAESAIDSDARRSKTGSRKR